MVLRRLNAERAFHEMNDALITAGGLDLSATTISIDDTEICLLPFAEDRPPRRITVARPELAALADAAIADSAHALAPNGYALGGVRWSEIAGIADTVITGSGLLTDTMAGHAPRLYYAPGDLAIMGGSGRGLLLVQGNLQLRSTRFAGVVLVAGSLDAEDVEITGSVRSQGGEPSRIANSDLRYRHCAVARSLLDAAAARRVIAGGRRLMPTF
jgi:hypothetical protein